MMAMPFFVVGAIAGGLVYAYRRAQKNADSMDARGQTANAEGRDAHQQQDRSSEQ
jgi:uncharacterized membrane protein